MAKKYEIRNSTAEFLIFQIEGKEQGVEVYYKDENIWATQKAMATLFDWMITVVSPRCTLLEVVVIVRVTLQLQNTSATRTVTVVKRTFFIVSSV